MELMTEYWNSGTMEYWVKEDPFSHYPSIPTFQYSRFSYSIIPIFHL
jgi:hypothetical protein